jgi:hypothetical protein
MKKRPDSKFNRGTLGLLGVLAFGSIVGAPTLAHANTTYTTQENAPCPGGKLGQKTIATYDDGTKDEVCEAYSTDKGGIPPTAKAVEFEKRVIQEKTAKCAGGEREAWFKKGTKEEVPPMLTPPPSTDPAADAAAQAAYANWYKTVDFKCVTIEAPTTAPVAATEEQIKHAKTRMSVHEQSWYGFTPYLSMNTTLRLFAPADENDTRLNPFSNGEFCGGIVNHYYRLGAYAEGCVRWVNSYHTPLPAARIAVGASYKLYQRLYVRLGLFGTVRGSNDHVYMGNAAQGIVKLESDSSAGVDASLLVHITNRIGLTGGIEMDAWHKSEENKKYVVAPSTGNPIVAARLGFLVHLK